MAFRSDLFYRALKLGDYSIADMEELAMTCGYRVFVCSNMAFAGDFTPVTMLQ